MAKSNIEKLNAELPRLAKKLEDLVSVGEASATSTNEKCQQLEVKIKQLIHGIQNETNIAKDYDFYDNASQVVGKITLLRYTTHLQQLCYATSLGALLNQLVITIRSIVFKHPDAKLLLKTTTPESYNAAVLAYEKDQLSTSVDNARAILEQAKQQQDKIENAAEHAIEAAIETLETLQGGQQPETKPLPHGEFNKAMETTLKMYAINAAATLADNETATAQANLDYLCHLAQSIPVANKRK